MVQVRVGDAVRGGIGLAAERLGHGPATLVTTASDHVALRTPSRPDHHSGQAIHLYEPPTRLRPWLRRLATTVGAVPGVTEAMLCWEVDDPAPPAAAATVPDDLPDDVATNLVAVQEWRPDLSRADEAARRAALANLEVRDPAVLDIRSAAAERVMAGARALYLQAGWGSDVDYWQWHAAQHLDLMVAGRCATWVVYVMGVPACRAAIVHDRRDLAIVEDVVTHPLHRGTGLASALVAHVLRAHLAERPADRVVVRADAGGPAQRLYERLGFAPIATDVGLRVPLTPGPATVGDA